jgi:hypothetical protein
MRLLPFMDISVVEGDTPYPVDRLKGLVEWANGDKAKLSAGFLAYESEGDSPDDYLFQIAYIKDDCLVTDADVIKEVGTHCVEYRQWKEQTRMLVEVRCHLELYFSKINTIPPWGTVEYSKLIRKGHTPRVLEGPHKVGRLKPGERRKVVLGPGGEIVFGPVI